MVAKIKLTIQEQIDILTKAKEAYSKSINYSPRLGMCFYIANELIKFDFRCNTLYKYLDEYFPTFTYEHICYITKGTDLYPTELDYYWDRQNKEVREKVFDLLINELKQQLQ